MDQAGNADAPLVTVVTPSFNQAHFIRETIESVLAQDYPNFEYLVVDGGSTDGTADVVAPFRDRLTWISEPDTGQSNAINKGFARARGEIVYWACADDWMQPHAIAAAVPYFVAQPELAAVVGQVHVRDRSGRHLRTTRRTIRCDPRLHRTAYLYQAASFFRRSAVEAVGMLREDLHYAMDWELFQRLQQRFPIAYVPEVLGAYRSYPETKTASGRWRRLREALGILRHGSLPYRFRHALHQGAWAVSRWIEPDLFNRPPRGPRARLAQVVDAVCGVAGVSTYGWSAASGMTLRTVTLMSCGQPSGADTLLLRGNLLHWFARWRPRLEVWAGRQRLACLALEDVFELAVPFEQREASPQWLRLRMRGLLPLSCRLWEVSWIRLEHCRCEGIWDDGWASRLVRVLLPAGRQRLVVTATVPDDCPGLHGQVLAVLHGDRCLASVELGPSTTVHEVALPAGAREIRIRACRSLVPASISASPDRRALSWRPISIEALS